MEGRKICAKGTLDTELVGHVNGSHGKGSPAVVWTRLQSIRPSLTWI